MTKNNLWKAAKAVMSIIVIILSAVTLITGIRLSMQIAFLILGVLTIINTSINKHKNKIINFLCIGSGIFVIFAAVYSFAVYSYRPYRDKAIDLSYEIRTELKTPKSDKIVMKQLTGNYAWDTMYIITPYTDVNEFLSKNKLSWYGDKKESIEYLDTIELLIFTLGNKVSCYAEIKRSDSSINFSEIVYKNNGKNRYTSQEANFELE